MDAKQENNMKDLTTTPTAELLAQWGKLTEISKHPNYARDTTFDKVVFEGKIAAIAAELDIRTVGMSLMDGMSEISIDHVSILKQMTLPPKPIAVKVNIPIDELIERLKWLQIKGGK